jgi:hypothetical protein
VYTVRSVHSHWITSPSIHYLEESRGVPSLGIGKMYILLAYLVALHQGRDRARTAEVDDGIWEGGRQAGRQAVVREADRTAQTDVDVDADKTCARGHISRLFFIFIFFYFALRARFDSHPQFLPWHGVWLVSGRTALCLIEDVCLRRWLFVLCRVAASLCTHDLGRLPSPCFYHRMSVPHSCWSRISSRPLLEPDTFPFVESSRR